MLLTYYDFNCIFFPVDCREVSTTGVNYILPRGGDDVLKVYCDQDVSGGGWTLIQRRTNGKEDFNQNWAAYKSGTVSIYSFYYIYHLTIPKQNAKCL